MIIEPALLALIANVAQCFLSCSLIKLTLKVCAHQLDKVSFVDLLITSFGAEVFTDHVSIFITDSDASFVEAVSKFLHRQPSIAISVVLIKQLA